MIRKYQSSGKKLCEFILDETGLDLRGLENGRLLALTHEIVEKAKLTPAIAHHPKIIGNCEFLPQLAKYGPLPEDCKIYVAQLYSHLKNEDQSYIQTQLSHIRAGTYQGLEALTTKIA